MTSSDCLSCVVVLATFVRAVHRLAAAYRAGHAGGKSVRILGRLNFRGMTDRLPPSIVFYEASGTNLPHSAPG